ncbi:hypothetical protein CUMW_251110 [Citrus unshiu]|uniref:Uncharacterized protein n=1 Tax=Citrus unshiu TaxID=55188 RepID=A0A2H5QQ40_CITUN|nr:hypothetical protein CUMW_251110 [Citrus unshiu]
MKLGKLTSPLRVQLLVLINVNLPKINLALNEFAPMILIHHDPQLWGEDVKFKPEDFLRSLKVPTKISKPVVFLRSLKFQTREEFQKQLRVIVFLQEHILDKTLICRKPKWLWH